MRFGFVLLCGAATAAAAQDASTQLDIGLASGTAAEAQGRTQLGRILIEANVIPHSHPVLTVNTRYLSNDTAQLATFVHEQLHWFFGTHQQATDSAGVRGGAATARPDPRAPAAVPVGRARRAQLKCVGA